ncbi:cysteine--tRNA ligase NDAI_0F03980 [Naumovozyma dairenensis CBS 421]|uniref:cysteine--tRNA ligase n=1 Tax=Naumovozyma dairenensis (strain ATCC 10597 / BCRC 20456 / CBS 421 / NBRC 0211 / NRRL Y-12639) TaxID=1071378 RepID=G0WD55_NAUDC|nr:hypothetical protein NDAI_0F03980 [Naumovozyma dairenensis CBS 421]CCD25716.1 hypothetical protein NDAI_0F03980 [Naumovozyma dairenensis CBS 421]
MHLWKLLRRLPTIIVKPTTSTIATTNIIPIPKMSTPTASQPKVAQPKWYKPSPKNDAATNSHVLKLYNTLTRTKEPFIPQSGTKQVSWYSCGPTVYDASHMGHARNYVSIDINRRIMENYFGYDINFVQNVTDIDDKIIIRARQNYLFEQYVKENSTAIDISYIKTALSEYITKNLKLEGGDEFQSWLSSIDLEKEKELNPKLPMHIKAIETALLALTSIPKNPEEINNFYNNVKDVLVPLLDEQLGSTLNDPELFRKLPAFWERQYDKDMAKLNVMPPSITTRVSEYIPEIIVFVEKIIANGYAYATSDGSVYFDTIKFDSASNHDYAKCQPWNKGQLDLIEDAEGSLSNFTNSNKKSKNDFALWKASKPGEPQWESPWGTGRPGWHIECSVMASDVHGQSMDIHSGGIDLAFPHHDNELAQSEAKFDNCQWVNYFLHTGHLHIEGQKMSKSLKNFITIEEALQKYSTRQLRLAFASVQWNNQLDFKESLINEVKSLETTFNNFFKNIRALNHDYISQLSHDNNAPISKKLTNLERDLLKNFHEAQDKVHVSFCDNLSTPQVLKTLSDLITLSNTYISNVGTNLKIEPLLGICKYVTKILDILGFPARSDQLGWVNVSSVETQESGSIEDVAMPYVKCLSTFRDQIRSLAISGADVKEFLKLTDNVRDQDLLNLNVALDDRNGQSALIKFLTTDEKNEMLKLNEEKLVKEQAKAQRKLEQERLKKQKEEERREKARVSPLEMFKTDAYSAWDEQGLPTKDKDGNDVTKSMTKKLKKQWDQQNKLHQEYFG